VGPIFIRRGDILFVIKSHQDFIRFIESGKIYPTDKLLIKDLHGMDWLPLGEISHFQVTGNSIGESSPDSISYNPSTIFDHIKQPRFNLSVLFAGGLWYLMHSMPKLGLNRLLIAFATSTLLITGGSLLSISPVYIILMLMLTWFGSNTFYAFQADKHLNRLQVERFHQQPNLYADGLHDLEMIDFPDSNPSDFYIPTIREQILN
jgi:hypothetical protein